MPRSCLTAGPGERTRRDAANSLTHDDCQTVHLRFWLWICVCEEAQSLTSVFQACLGFRPLEMKLTEDGVQAGLWVP